MLVNYCTLDNLRVCKMYSLIQFFYCKRVFFFNKLLLRISLQACNLLSHMWVQRTSEIYTWSWTPYLEGMIYYFLYKYINNEVFLNFPRIFQKLSEGRAIVSGHFSNMSEDTEDCRRLPMKIWRRFDHTPTNLSTVKGFNIISSQWDIYRNFSRPIMAFLTAGNLSRALWLR